MHGAIVITRTPHDEFLDLFSNATRRSKSY